MRHSRTRYVLLGLLLGGPQTGYELRRQIEHQISHFWNESPGQIYPELHRLVADRLAVSRGGTQRAGRTRIVYSLTAAGRKTFRQWLTQPAEPQPVRNELLLKLFFGWELELAAAGEQIARFEQQLRRLNEVYEQARREIAADNDVSDTQRFCWELSLDLGQRVLDARLAWCLASRQKLDQRPGRQAPAAGSASPAAKPRKRPAPTRKRGLP